MYFSGVLIIWESLTNRVWPAPGDTRSPGQPHPRPALLGMGWARRWNGSHGEFKGRGASAPDRPDTQTRMRPTKGAVKRSGRQKGAAAPVGWESLLPVAPRAGPPLSPE